MMTVQAAAVCLFQAQLWPLVAQMNQMHTWKRMTRYARHISGGSKISAKTTRNGQPMGYASSHASMLAKAILMMTAQAAAVCLLQAQLRPIVAQMNQMHTWKRMTRHARHLSGGSQISAKTTQNGQPIRYASSHALMLAKAILKMTAQAAAVCLLQAQLWPLVAQMNQMHTWKRMTRHARHLGGGSQISAKT